MSSPSSVDAAVREPIRVALLGSTGSIGRQAIDVLTGHPAAFRVVALAAGHDAGRLSEQAARFRPAVVAMADRAAAAGLDLPPGTILEGGPDALERLAVRDDVDLLVVGTGGIVSLRPGLAALAAGKIVATANKETLVAGGHLVMPIARALATATGERDPQNGLASPLAWLRPIDSEHSAIWQCLAGESMTAVARLILTASGGPSLDASAAELAHQLVDLFPKFLSWLISFIIVCKFWLNHHHMLGLARQADYAMVWLNSIFLMFQSFIPFPTALMGEYPPNRLAVSIFGLVMALNTMLFIALQAYILRRLIQPELVAAQDPHLTRKSFVGVVSYLFGAAAAWFSVQAAFVVYLITPTFFIVPPAGRRAAMTRDAAEPSQSAPH